MSKQMEDLDWLARNEHKWPGGDHQPWCYVYWKSGRRAVSGNCITVIQPCAKIEKAQWTARRADLQNKPRWLDAPEWAEWLAQDADGEWYWYKSKPVETKECHWHAGNQFCAKGVVLGDWRDTLEQRPADMHKSEPEIDTSAERVQETEKSIHDWHPTELPPIGVDCELVIGPVPARCCVVAYSSEQVVVRWAENGLMDLIELPLPLSYQFRPLRTERDVLLSIIQSGHFTDGDMADAILAAGFTRKETV